MNPISNSFKSNLNLFREPHSAADPILFLQQERRFDKF